MRDSSLALRMTEMGRPLGEGMIQKRCGATNYIMTKEKGPPIGGPFKNSILLFTSA
jgi:hypothetical protein